jgi:hypothetical protein
MASHTPGGLTRCKACGVHLEVVGRNAFCINRRCKMRQKWFRWGKPPGDYDLEQLASELYPKQAIFHKVSRRTLLPKSVAIPESA